MWRILKPRHRNFYVENGVAYTEDVKEVRRVEVLANLPISKQSLVEHFSRFGSVQVVQWDEEKLSGSVLFEEATQAAEALYCLKHKYNGCELCLRAGDTWDQPPDREEPGRQSADCLPIVDDAWGLVLDYLPLNARLNFASSCQRFQTIYQLESQHMSRVLNIKQVCMLTAWNIKEMMRLSGEHIHRLEGGPLHPCWPHFNQFVQLLGSSCPNLTELSFHRISLSPYHMQNLFESPNGLHKVTSLALRRCDLSDRDLLYLQPLTQLRTLDLRENNGLWGSTLGNLPDSVETLNLSGCENLEPTLLSNLEALPLLRELRCPQIRLRNFNHEWMDEFQVENLATDEHVYRELVQSCPLLEVLEVTVCPYMDEPQLGGLSHLRTFGPSRHSIGTATLPEFREGGPGFVDEVGLKIISQLKEIRSLVLRNQDFEAHELRQLRKLNALELLDLSDSPHLSNEIASQLAKTLSRLRQLKVKRCPLISRRLIEILKDRTMLQVDI
ncbi:hypothetical protein M5D96_002400 [Drosophila gunungcola]|uniref:RRM domain-containing protein n=1 Tax=Drosophila gunungcola TaxID=103775 RepID=A0A9P9Z0A1_9MUSC|nr:hypothetical protein M5D96_002400 [Drosophila gunungcola]